jgi:putative ABC transport system substrate-binding protein
VARAQQPAIPVIGLVSLAAADVFADDMRAFHKGLGDAGYVEGQNVLIEYHWLEGQSGGVPMLMANLVRSRVAAIAIPGTTAVTVAAKAATSTIPIVFFVGDDPVKLGLVESQARPGGNATGVNYLVADAVAKRLSLLHELVPKAVSVGVLTNPANAVATDVLLARLQEDARNLGLQIRVLRASTTAEIDIAFDAVRSERHDALFVAPDTFFSSHRAQFAAVAARERVPACYGDRETVAAGGLIELRRQLFGEFSAARLLHRQNPKGGKAGRAPGRAGDQVRFRHQSQNSQSPRPHHPGNAVGDRR